MDDLLRLAVLTSPLWLILILLPISIWVAIKVSKHFKGISARIAVSISIIALVFVALFADETVGKMYLDDLCDNEAGVKNYQAVELPPEYWDEQGTAKFFDSYGKPDHKLWVTTIDRSDRKIESYSPVFSIDKDVSLMKEKASGMILAKVTTFRYWGGWFRRNFSLHNTANSCKFHDDQKLMQVFYSKLFKPKNSSK